MLLVRIDGLDSEGHLRGVRRITAERRKRRRPDRLELLDELALVLLSQRESGSLGETLGEHLLDRLRTHKRRVRGRHREEREGG